MLQYRYTFCNVEIILNIPIPSNIKHIFWVKNLNIFLDFWSVCCIFVLSFVSPVNQLCNSMPELLIPIYLQLWTHWSTFLCVLYANSIPHYSPQPLVTSIPNFCDLKFFRFHVWTRSCTTYLSPHIKISSFTPYTLSCMAGLFLWLNSILLFVYVMENRPSITRKGPQRLKRQFIIPLGFWLISEEPEPCPAGLQDF